MRYDYVKYHFNRAFRLEWRETPMVSSEKKKKEWNKSKSMEEEKRTRHAVNISSQTTCEFDSSAMQMNPVPFAPSDSKRVKYL